MKSRPCMSLETMAFLRFQINCKIKQAYQKAILQLSEHEGEVDLVFYRATRWGVFSFQDLTKCWYILSYVLLNAPIHSYQAIHMIRKNSSQGNDTRGQTLPCFSDMSWKKLSVSASISRRIPAVGYRSLESINKISR